MFNYMDSGTPWMASIYYYIIILIGSYFILNLILAVILSSFLKIQEDEDQEISDDLLRKKISGKQTKKDNKIAAEL